MRAVDGFDGGRTTREIPVVFDPVATAAGYPAVQVERDGSIGRNPFTVVFAGYVKMGCIVEATFAGRVSHAFIAEEVISCCNAPSTGNVHVHSDPASLFVSVIIEVLKD